MRTLPPGAFAIALLTMPNGMADAEPPDQSCTSASSCSRYVACSTGFTKTTRNRTWLCKRQTTASRRRPTCAKRGGKTDWRWSVRAKMCRRAKATGAVEYSSANIRCGAGHHYDGSSGTCLRAGKTIYAQTELSVSTVSTIAPRICDSPASCGKRVSCPAGYTRYTRGNKFYCAAPSKTGSKTSYRPARMRSKRTTDSRAN